VARKKLPFGSPNNRLAIRSLFISFTMSLNLRFSKKKNARLFCGLPQNDEPLAGLPARGRQAFTVRRTI